MHGLHKKRASKAIVQLLTLVHYNNILDEERLTPKSHFFQLLKQPQAEVMRI